VTVVVSIFMAVGVTACGGGHKNSGNPDAHASYSTLVGASVTLLGKGNPGAAEQLLEQAVAKNPHSPVAYYDLGVAYQRQGNTRQAARNYLHAIAVDRNYVPALFNQAEIFSKRNAPLAIFYYRRIIHLKPDSPTAYLNLGLLEAATKALHRQAVADLTKAVKLDPSLRGQVPAPLRADVQNR
jgi:tetratricopeptide (TPR) repeat protein